MRRRMPWVLALPLAFVGSWVAHVVGRATTVGSVEATEATRHIERTSISHTGAAALGLSASLAPFAAMALVAFAAWWWSKTVGKPSRGAGPGWFLVLPVVGYFLGESLERLTGGGSQALSLHAVHEPGLMLAFALQVPFGIIAYAIARLVVAAARAIVARVRRRIPDARRRQGPTGVTVPQIAPSRWSCLVGAHGVRGPPTLVPA